MFSRFPEVRIEVLPAPCLKYISNALFLLFFNFVGSDHFQNSEFDFFEAEYPFFQDIFGELDVPIERGTGFPRNAEDVVQPCLCFMVLGLVFAHGDKSLDFLFNLELAGRVFDQVKFVHIGSVII